MRLVTLTVALASASGVALAQADDFNRVVVFGDSLTDAGTYGSRFTTNPGLVSTQLLAQEYGSSILPAIPLGGPPTPNAWIYGSGGVGVTTSRSGPSGSLSVVQQVDAFLATSAPRSSDLIFLQGGPNDIFAIAPTINPANTAPATAAIAAEATALGNQLDRLRGAGLILVSNIPDISGTPGGQAQSAAARQGIDLLVSTFNTTSTAQCRRAAATSLCSTPMVSLGRSPPIPDASGSRPTPFRPAPCRTASSAPHRP